MRTPLGKKRISLLVRFLEIWYTPEELISEYKRIEENIDEVFKLGRVEEAKKSLKHLCYIHEAVPLRFKHDISEKLIDKFLEVGDMQGAKEVIKRIELQAKNENDPKKLSIFFVDIASSYMKINDKTKVLETVEKLLKITPEVSNIYGFCGNMLKKLGRYDEALKSFNRAIELDPTNHLAYHEKGNVLLELGKPKEALKCFDKAIELDPDCASYWAVRSRVLADLNEEKEALESINRAIELDPKNSAVKCYYGRTLLKLRKYREASKCFEEAITLGIKCECTSLLAEYGLSLASIKKYEDALKSVERAVEISRKDDVETLNELTNLFVGIALEQSIYYLKKENFNQALESLKKSLRFSKERERKGELDRKLEKVFIEYLKKIASTKNYEFTEKALTIIIETLGDNYKELLMPFSKAIEYLITKNTEILDTLQQEVRDTVLEIIGDISDIKIDQQSLFNG
ncbi:TPR repeat-containing protein YrrB [archaeon]|nr:TPR repeat-containing protein YrrB [archaeon]